MTLAAGPILRSTQIIGLACVTLFSGLAVASGVAGIEEPTLLVTTVLLVGFALPSALLVSAFFLEAHEVSEEGLAFRNFLGMTKRLRWSELRAIRGRRSQLSC